MAVLTLGGLELDGFEIPAGVRFGGAQRVVVHRLIGGARVIDTLGRDDAALRWSGIISGTDAADRARAFDAMRAAGQTLELAWNAFAYSAIITELDLDFSSPWWIPYRIACTVVADLAQSFADFLPDLAESVTADLAQAALFTDVSGAVAATSAQGGLVPGNPALLTSAAAVAGVQAVIGQGIVTAGQGLDGDDLTQLVSSSGTLAQLTCAKGYVGRCLANLQGGEA
jgi:hypothetical protein